MKIEKLEVGFTSIVNIGRCAYFIYTNKNGAFIEIDELFENARSFSRVVVTGDEPFFQKEELAKLFKKLVKTNPRIKIEVHTEGLIKPIEVSGYANNVIFNVFVKMKWEPDYKINEQVLAWYNEIGANFIFRIQEQKELDDIAFVCNSIGIKKSQTFLCPMNEIPQLTRHAKFYGYNIAPYVQWDTD
jgi:hypothetical protein